MNAHMCFERVKKWRKSYLTRFFYVSSGWKEEKLIQNIDSLGVETTPDNRGVGTYVLSYGSEYIFSCMNTYSKKCS